jgi:hypothetical protein
MVIGRIIPAVKHESSVSSLVTMETGSAPPVYAMQVSDSSEQCHTETESSSEAWSASQSTSSPEPSQSIPHKKEHYAESLVDRIVYRLRTRRAVDSTSIEEQIDHDSTDEDDYPEVDNLSHNDQSSRCTNSDGETDCEGSVHHGVKTVLLARDYIPDNQSDSSSLISNLSDWSESPDEIMDWFDERLRKIELNLKRLEHPPKNVYDNLRQRLDILSTRIHHMVTRRRRKR